MAWQPRRIKNSLLVLISLLGSWVVVDLMLSSIVGFNPLDKGQEDQTFSRLEGASRKGVALARSQSEGQRIGLVIGMSTAEYGVDLRTLDQSTAV